MTQGNATLIIDFGNSETRGTVLYGKDSTTGRYHEKSFALSNRFYPVEENYVPSADYSDDTSTILKCSAVVNGEPFDGTFANGEVQLKEFNVAPLRPSAIEKKYKSFTTALSYELAMLYAHKAVARMARVSAIQSLDITWSVVALLPPGDFEIGKEEYKKLIESIEYVKTTYPACDMKINLRKVTVLPEGFCAFIGCVFDKGHIIRPEQQYLLEETTLVFDIGAGTTDIMVVKDNKTINTTMYTIEKGGNNVTQSVKKELRRMGIVIQETELITGITSGTIKDGAKVVDISAIVNKAKSELASMLVSETKNYFEDNQFPIRSIGRVLVCGGGAIEVEGGKMCAVSTEIIKFLKNLSPNVEMVEYPCRQVTKYNEDGTTYKAMDKTSPRDLNIVGASILAELL